LSVIIENRTLEELSTIEESKGIANSSNDMLTTLVSEDIGDNQSNKTNEVLDNSNNEYQTNKVINETNNENQTDEVFNKLKNEISRKSNVADTSKSKMLEMLVKHTTNTFDIETEYDQNNIFSNTTLDEKKYNKNDLMLSAELLKNESNTTFTDVENQLDNTMEEIFDFENTNKIMLNHNNVIGISDSNTNELILLSEKQLQNSVDHKHCELLNHTNQQPNVLDITDNISDSLAEFNQMEHMVFKEEKEVPIFEYKTPKTQKLLDLSLVQQTSPFVSQSNKHKLLNFSIVEQTPTSKRYFN